MIFIGKIHEYYFKKVKLLYHCIKTAYLNRQSDNTACCTVLQQKIKENIFAKRLDNEHLGRYNIL